MFAMAAARLGYRVHVFTPEEDAPATDVASKQIIASFDDLDAVAEFARGVSVVTFEFENIPARTADAVARFAPVRPSGSVLHTTQDRLREKSFLRSAGIPCTPFAEATTHEQLHAAIAELGLPAVLKTAAWGYDGKGQASVATPQQANQALTAFSGQRVIYEAQIDFHCELSIIAARSPTGETAFFGPIYNEHAHHILDVSIYPHDDIMNVHREAEEIARAVLDGLNVVGLICIEFFLTRTGKLLVNEIAPRPHNSGHLTIDAAACSQFEQQVRTVCGLPLGSFALTAPAAAMANLLGDLWQQGEPHWDRVLTDERLRLHLYGKSEARPGRKMGHLTALAESAGAAADLARHGRASLSDNH
jgi:5-(carboxyamino)imidazole ribonucleotide synthase